VRDLRECWALGKVPKCNVNSCGEPHYKMLHMAIKGQQRPRDRSGIRRELLLGLGIDPDSDTMEVKVKMQEPEDQLNGGPPAEAVGGEEQLGRRLSGKLLDAFTLLHTVRERFMSHL
jgi:hypothetical protein